MVDSLLKSHIVAAHRPRWRGVLTWLALISPGFGAIALLALVELPLWVTAGLILVVSYQMHTSLIAFHEASHGSLCPRRWLNDALGRFIGVFSFMSLTLFRAAHKSHHAHLGTTRDEELWPFVLTTAPQWSRRLAAFVELNFGLLFTPLLFLRSFLRPGSPVRDPAVRRTIWFELASIVVVWSGIFAAVIIGEGWHLLLVTYLIPAFIAGNLQSWRKYVEHMGMFGTTAVGCMRSIHSSRLSGELVSFSMLNEPYHGIHHQYPHLPQTELPRFTGLLSPRLPDERPPFRSYLAAVWDMVRTLPDPRVGAQWLPASDSPSEPNRIRMRLPEPGWQDEGTSPPLAPTPDRPRP